MVGYMNTTINNYARKIDNIIYTKKLKFKNAGSKFICSSCKSNSCFQ